MMQDVMRRSRRMLKKNGLMDQRQCMRLHSTPREALDSTYTGGAIGKNYQLPVIARSISKMDQQDGSWISKMDQAGNCRLICDLHLRTASYVVHQRQLFLFATHLPCFRKQQIESHIFSLLAACFSLPCFSGFSLLAACFVLLYYEAGGRHEPPLVFPMQYPLFLSIFTTIHPHSHSHTPRSALAQ